MWWLSAKRSKKHKKQQLYVREMHLEQERNWQRALIWGYPNNNLNKKVFTDIEY